MEFGRRNFLKFVGMAVAGSAIDPLSPFIQNEQYFINNKLGFGFMVPNGWDVEAFSSFDEMKGKQKLSLDPDLDPDLDPNDPLFEDIHQVKGLAALLRKYPDSMKVFSPCVTFFMEGDEELDNYDSLVELSRDAITGFAKMLADYECIEEPREINGSNFTAVISKSKFLFEYEEMIPTLIDNEMMLVHYNNTIYSIHMYDSPYIGDTAQNEFRRFKDSLHIV